MFPCVTCIEELQNVEVTLYRSIKNVSDSADGTLTLYPFSKSSLENSESTGGDLRRGVRHSTIMNLETRNQKSSVSGRHTTLKHNGHSIDVQSKLKEGV